ncbi:probable NAD(P)H dehydrogenase subunit CRR3, chloroplastic [Musa acuminata AAA Group]|uniref:probable NAD(P)H dehydrogenase subunit CRR3, chloroplastic n=1 Tax=Musa acuminata AAA Group TaxID=214697 RepID=UPI0031E15E63
MGWAAVAAEGLGVRGCCSLPVASAKSSLGRPTIVASKTTRPRRRVNGSPPRKLQPSVAEVQKAIGVVDDPFRSPDGASSSSSSSSPFLGFLQDESPAERKLRKAAEWVVDSTEAQAQSGQRILLLVCLNILPVWLLLLLVASGVVKLPFDLPFWNDLIS